MNSKIIIKLGTKAIFDSKNNKIKTDVLKSLSRGVSQLLKKGKEIIIVSSGAVGCGRNIIGNKKELGAKQAQAAVGQIKLMEKFSEIFSKKSIHVAQFLLNTEDLNSKKLQNILAAYENLKGKAIPIINENDVTTTDELSFGDNDNLSSEILEKFNFDTLLILTEKGALIKNKKPVITSNKFSIEDYDNLSTNDGYGFGGLASKLDVAKKVAKKGKEIIIAKAGDDLIKILNGNITSTKFVKNI